MLKQTSDRFDFDIKPYCLNEFLPQRMDIIRICCTPHAWYSMEPGRLNFLIRKAIQIDFGTNILSTAYTFDETGDVTDMAAYLMVSRGDNAYPRIKESIEMQYKKLRASLVDAKELLHEKPAFKYSLAQLLMGYMDNSVPEFLDPEHELVWNNTLGETIIILDHKDWRKTWTDTTQHYSHGVPTWNGREFSKRRMKIGMAIKVNSEGIITQHAIPFVELPYDLANTSDGRIRLGRGYSIGDNGRIHPEYNLKGKQGGWFQQGEKAHPANLPFIDYSSLSSFTASRMGMLARYIEELDKRIGKGCGDKALMTLRPWTYPGSSAQRIDNTFPENVVLEKCIKRVRNNLHISSLDGEDVDSKTLTGILRNVLSGKEFGIELQEGYDEGAYNLLLHHEKDYYDNKKVTDSRLEFSKSHPNSVVQGITFESLEPPKEPQRTSADTEEKFKRKLKHFNEKTWPGYIKKMESMMKIVIISLGIKKEILSKGQRITLANMDGFGIHGTVHFAIREPRKKEQKYDRFYTMSLNTVSGKFAFDQFTTASSFNRSHKDAMYVVQAFQRNSSSINTVDPDIELVVWQDPRDMYQFFKTEEHTIPNIEAILNGLRDVNRKMTKEDFWNIFDRFVNWLPTSGLEEIPTQEDIERYRSDIILKMTERNLKDEDVFANFQKVLCYGFHGETRMYKIFSDYLIDEEGILVDAKIRNQEYDEKYKLDYRIGNLVGGWYFPTPDYLVQGGTTIQNSISYFIGLKGMSNLTMSGPDKGTLYRKIVRRNGQPVNKEFILPLLRMCIVDFVRLEQNTVRPFPVKYLNEYKNIISPNADRIFSLDMPVDPPIMM